MKTSQHRDMTPTKNYRPILPHDQHDPTKRNSPPRTTNQPYSSYLRKYRQQEGLDSDRSYKTNPAPPAFSNLQHVATEYKPFFLNHGMKSSLHSDSKSIISGIRQVTPIRAANEPYLANANQSKTPNFDNKKEEERTNRGFIIEPQNLFK